MAISIYYNSKNRTATLLKIHNFLTSQKTLPVILLLILLPTYLTAFSLTLYPSKFQELSPLYYALNQNLSLFLIISLIIKIALFFILIDPDTFFPEFLLRLVEVREPKYLTTLPLIIYITLMTLDCLHDLRELLVFLLVG